MEKKRENMNLDQTMELFPKEALTKEKKKEPDLAHLVEKEVERRMEIIEAVYDKKFCLDKNLFAMWHDLSKHINSYEILQIKKFEKDSRNQKRTFFLQIASILLILFLSAWIVVLSNKVNSMEEAYETAYQSYIEAASQDAGLPVSNTGNPVVPVDPQDTEANTVTAQQMGTEQVGTVRALPAIPAYSLPRPSIPAPMASIAPAAAPKAEPSSSAGEKKQSKAEDMYSKAISFFSADGSADAAKSERITYAKKSENPSFE